MELAQITHLAGETLPFDYDSEKAGRLRPVLAEVLTAIERIAATLAKGKRT